MDSYRGDLIGKYEKRILINGQIAWSDDIEGDEYWRQVEIPLIISSTRGRKCGHKVCAPCGDKRGIDEVLGVRFTIDDVHVFGGSVGNGNMEAKSGWRYQKTHGLWSGKFSTIDKLVGTFPSSQPSVQESGSRWHQRQRRKPYHHPTTRILDLDFDAAGIWANKDRSAYRLDISQPEDMSNQLVADGLLGGKAFFSAPNTAVLLPRVSSTNCLIWVVLN